MAGFRRALSINAIEAARRCQVVVECGLPVPRLRRAATVRERPFGGKPCPIRVIEKIDRDTGFAADVG